MITGLLILLPAAALFASLALGRYPGEAVLDEARTPVRAPRPRPALALLAPPHALRAVAAPALLVAAPVAARAPPCG